MYPGKRHFRGMFFCYRKQFSAVSDYPVSVRDVRCRRYQTFLCTGRCHGHRSSFSMYSFFFSSGSSFSVLFLITTRSFCERIQYFITYMENCRNAGEIIPYRRKEITAPENFHFTVPVFLSVMLYVGGIY